VSAGSSRVGSLVAAVKARWNAGIPPHSFALLRIALGLMGLLSLVALTPVEMFWPLDGLTPLSADGTGPRAWLLAHGFGTVAGWALFLALTVVFAALTVGWWSDAAVLGAFVGLIAQDHWNNIPLSSAHRVLIVTIFCLLWAETGRVWSLDAFLSGRAHDPDARVPPWPLWLMRCQVAVIYGSTGLHKLAYPVWRDGSGVHWALNLNVFHRLPWAVPPEAATLVALATWATLAFELLFPILVMVRRLRPWVLIAGVGLHLGLWATLELGPFSWIMLATYIAFLDPDTTSRLFRRDGKSGLGAAARPSTT
jgi:hypothetical protein